MLSVNQMFYGTDEPVWLVDGSSPSPVKYHYLESVRRGPSPPRKVHFNDELRPQSVHRGPSPPRKVDFNDELRPQSVHRGPSPPRKAHFNDELRPQSVHRGPSPPRKADFNDELRPQSVHRGPSQPRKAHFNDELRPQSVHRGPSPPRKAHFNDELRPHSYLHQGSHRELRSVDAPTHVHSRSTMPYSSMNPAPAPIVIPSVDALTRVHSRPTMPYSSMNPPPAPIVVPRETKISHTPVLPVVKPGMREDTPYTLLLRVPLCCEGCEKRIIKKLRKVDGVMSVSCDIDRQRVTVRGTADTDEVLRVAKKEFKRSTLW